MSLTAFPQTEETLRQQFAGATFAVASLQRPLPPCDLSVCKGMCCYDGVYLEDDEAKVIAELAHSEADFFRELGLSLPEAVVVPGDFHGLMTGPKTATTPRQWRNRVENYPAHFEDTSCCFLLEDGRCSLQVLSVARDRHRWYYKPTGCWLHPLTTHHAPEATIGLHDEASEPYLLPHYDGFVTRTFCGACRENGPRAWETLQDELAFLGAILDRDLIGELRES
jgi:hypothetical protein